MTENRRTEGPEDLRVEIKLSSTQEDSKVLSKKLKDLVSSAFGESSISVTEVISSVQYKGKLRITTAIMKVAVFYPKE